MLVKRLLRLAMMAAVASAIASLVQAARKGPARDVGSAGKGSVDSWPEVPRNPDQA